MCAQPLFPCSSISNNFYQPDHGRLSSHQDKITCLFCGKLQTKNLPFPSCCPTPRNKTFYKIILPDNNSVAKDKQISIGQAKAYDESLPVSPLLIPLGIAVSLFALAVIGTILG